MTGFELERRPTGELVNPATGEALAIEEATARRLVSTLGDVDDLVNRVKAYRQAIVDELAARADARGGRTVEVQGVRLEVNAPTEDVYDPDTLERELAPLLEAGKVAPELVAKLIVTPKPKPQPRRVDRRTVNTLKASDDRELLAALAAARLRKTNTRTVKVLPATSVDGTVEED